MKEEHNKIPRKFERITAKQLTESSGGKIGDIWHIYKNDFGYLGYNKNANKYYYMFVSHLRNKNFYEILKIV